MHLVHIVAPLRYSHVTIAIAHCLRLRPSHKIIARVRAVDKHVVPLYHMLDRTRARESFKPFFIPLILVSLRCHHFAIFLTFFTLHEFIFVSLFLLFFVCLLCFLFFPFFL